MEIEIEIDLPRRLAWQLAMEPETSRRHSVIRWRCIRSIVFNNRNNNNMDNHMDNNDCNNKRPHRGSQLKGQSWQFTGTQKHIETQSFALSVWPPAKRIEKKIISLFIHSVNHYRLLINNQLIHQISLLFNSFFKFYLSIIQCN